MQDSPECRLEFVSKTESWVQIWERINLFFNFLVKLLILGSQIENLLIHRSSIRRSLFHTQQTKIHWMTRHTGNSKDFGKMFGSKAIIWNQNIERHDRQGIRKILGKCLYQSNNLIGSLMLYNLLKPQSHQSHCFTWSWIIIPKSSNELQIQLKPNLVKLNSTYGSKSTEKPKILNQTRPNCIN